MKNVNAAVIFASFFIFGCSDAKNVNDQTQNQKPVGQHLINVNDKANTNATISFRCLNPEVRVAFDNRTFLDNGIGQASSAPVQFNINQDAEIGKTIFVNSNNNGVCIADVSSNHIITKAWVVIAGADTEQTIVDNVSRDWIIGQTRFSVNIQGNRHARFDVVNSQIKKKASVTLVFFLQYRSAT